MAMIIFRPLSQHKLIFDIQVRDLSNQAAACGSNFRVELAAIIPRVLGGCKLAVKSLKNPKKLDVQMTDNSYKGKNLVMHEHIKNVRTGRNVKDERRNNDVGVLMVGEAVGFRAAVGLQIIAVGLQIIEEFACR